MSYVDIPKLVEKPDGFPSALPCWGPNSYAGVLADIWCPKGHVGILTQHTVMPDGTVHPSLVCPREGCDWHVWGRLLDWTPPTTK